jgi:hypothetical protein
MSHPTWAQAWSNPTPVGHHPAGDGFGCLRRVSICNVETCGGSAPTPPAETVVSALCKRILSILKKVFASLFAKSEWVSGQRPETLKKNNFENDLNFVAP